MSTLKKRITEQFYCFNRIDKKPYQKRDLKLIVYSNVLQTMLVNILIKNKARMTFSSVIVKLKTLF